jgi:hypothetical protein
MVAPKNFSSASEFVLDFLYFINHNISTMKNYKVNVTVQLTVAADNEDALNHLLHMMDYKFTHVDHQSEIVDAKFIEMDVVSEY